MEQFLEPHPNGNRIWESPHLATASLSCAFINSSKQGGSKRLNRKEPHPFNFYPLPLSRFPDLIVFCVFLFSDVPLCQFSTFQSFPLNVPLFPCGIVDFRPLDSGGPAQRERPPAGHPAGGCGDRNPAARRFFGVGSRFLLEAKLKTIKCTSFGVVVCGCFCSGKPKEKPKTKHPANLGVRLVRFSEKDAPVEVLF